MGTLRFGSIELADCVGAFIRHAYEFFNVLVVFCKFATTVEIVCRLDLLICQLLLRARRCLKVGDFNPSKFLV